MSPKAQEFLGVDIGSSKVGLARGSNLARIAEPLMTVSYKDAMSTIESLIRQYKAAAIVVGLPRSLNGKETEQTRYTKEWVAEAKKILKLPFYLQDEALTSHLAEQYQSNIKVGLDAMAAAIILQDFLDTPPDERVEC